MKQKAAILEFGTSHDDIFYSQVRFLKESGYEVYLVLNRVFENRLSNYGEFDGTFLMDLKDVGYGDFIEVIKAWKFLRRNKIKYIILNTVQGTGARNFCLLPHWGMNLTGIVHNADLLAGKSSTFRFYIKPRLKKFFALNKYIWDNINLSKRFSYDWIYPIFTEKTKSVITKRNNEFWVVIPGNVETERRDYIGLLSALKGKQLPENLKFVLLGKSMHSGGAGEKIKALIKEYSLENNFVMFDGFVEWDAFNDYTSQADLIATLIHPSAKSFANYSTSKISGSYLIAFNNKVPLLSHNYFENYCDIAESAFFYESDDIYTQIISLYNNRQMVEQKKIEMQNNQNFDFEFQRLKYVALVEKGK
jgi:hypothetical protein